ncbi:hypothetical protein BT69DRAFT_1288769 [Atractiella rhizophila]|nr:hypothetical protein BT69DRAFT_1288769 [Atractiella rhizophila]
MPRSRLHSEEQSRRRRVQGPQALSERNTNVSNTSVVSFTALLIGELAACLAYAASSNLEGPSAQALSELGAAYLRAKSERTRMGNHP